MIQKVQVWRKPNKLLWTEQHGDGFCRVWSGRNLVGAIPRDKWERTSIQNSFRRFWCKEKVRQGKVASKGGRVKRVFFFFFFKMGKITAWLFCDGNDSLEKEKMLLFERCGEGMEAVSSSRSEMVNTNAQIKSWS